MTENEAIKVINDKYETFFALSTTNDFDMAMATAIKALEEIQEYRAIGLTPTMVQDTIKARDKAQKRAIENAHIVDEYRAIGTVEELKALKEKSEPKKPIYSDFDDNGDDEIIPYKAICPVCGNEFEFGSWNEEENHHCICGQKLDWQRKE